jgi:acylphosphatase
MDTDNVRIRTSAVVRGLVQGVYFRQSTAQRAAELGVDGWVRNLPDGSVEAVFEGRPEAVDAAIAFVRIGPPAARVDSVEVVTGEAPQGLAGFSVRR